VKHNRIGAAVSILAAGALLLSACGSDENKTSTGATTAGAGTAGDSASAVNCSGKKALKASGSSAQANAITRFVTA